MIEGLSFLDKEGEGEGRNQLLYVFRCEEKLERLTTLLKFMRRF